MNEQRDRELDTIRLERLDKINDLTQQRDALLAALDYVSQQLGRHTDGDCWEDTDQEAYDNARAAIALATPTSSEQAEGRQP